MTKIEAIENKIRGEVWKPVVGYEGLFEISSFGRIKTPRGKITTGYVNVHGYSVWNLSKDGGDTTLKMHRMVAQAFIPNPDNKPHVNHIDNDTLNNRFSNLEWCTPKENKAHSVKQDRHTKGELCHKAKVTKEDVVDIRKSKNAIKKLSEIYGISTAQIHRIRNRESWKHIA